MLQWYVSRVASHCWIKNGCWFYALHKILGGATIYRSPAAEPDAKLTVKNGDIVDDAGLPVAKYHSSRFRCQWNLNFVCLFNDIGIGSLTLLPEEIETKILGLVWLNGSENDIKSVSAR